MKTLNQFTDKVRQWVDNHPLINDFGTGPTSLIGLSKSMKFPYMWMNFAQDHSIRIDTNITPVPSLHFIFMDKTNKNINLNRDGNGLETTDGMEVKSDTYRLVLDFVKWLTEQDKIIIDGDVRVRSIIDESKEISSGWLVTVNFKMMYLECNDITK